MLRRCWGMHSNEFHSSYLREGDTVFVCLLADLRKNHATNFRKIRRKGGTRATEEETVRF